MSGGYAAQMPPVRCPLPPGSRFSYSAPGFASRFASCVVALRQYSMALGNLTSSHPLMGGGGLHPQQAGCGPRTRAVTSDTDHRGDRPPALTAPGTPRPARGCHTCPPALTLCLCPLPLTSSSSVVCSLSGGRGVVPPLHPEKGRQRNTRRELCVSDAVSMMTDWRGKAF